MNGEDHAITPEMTLRQAGPLWLETRRPFISETTHHDYCWYLQRLYEFFPGVHLEQITADTIRQYQLVRRSKVSPGMVNKETNTLAQILKRARLWGRIADQYQALPVSLEGRGRALTDEEEYRLFTIGKLNPNWALCYNVGRLSAHTAAGPGEIRHLKLKDVYLGEGDYKKAWIRIREEGAKNSYRIRSIPLDREAYEAVQNLYDLARRHGSHAEEHYLLPARKRHAGNGRNHRPECYEPTRCLTSFKTAWGEMCAAAGIQNFRMYDLRHHALTRLAEKAPEQVVLKIAGHCSPQMLRKVYAHVRDNAVREAIDSLSRTDGWKPTDKTLKLVQPKQFNSADVPAVKKRAQEIVRETKQGEEDQSWLRLMGGQEGGK
jgi:integrase